MELCSFLMRMSCRRNLVVRPRWLTVSICGMVLLSVSCIFEKRFSVEDALSDVRRIRRGQTKYFQKFGRYGLLEDLANEKLIPETLADGRNGNYSFDMKLVPNGFKLEASPLSDVGSCFFLDESGVIRASYDWKVHADEYSDAIKNQ